MNSITLNNNQDEILDYINTLSSPLKQEILRSIDSTGIGDAVSITVNDKGDFVLIYKFGGKPEGLIMLISTLRQSLIQWAREHQHIVIKELEDIIKQFKS